MLWLGVEMRNSNQEKTMPLIATEITRVTVRWDDQDPHNEGWYCESFAGQELIDDSQKIWFGVDTDNFGITSLAELRKALQEVFPNAEIG
jgi:hypothetical protein